MTKKYTEAYTITPHDTNVVEPRPDAYYVGTGNFTDEYNETDFYDPSVWFSGGRRMSSNYFTGSLSSWGHGGGDPADPGTYSLSGVDTITGTSDTNFVDVVHIKNPTSGITVSDASFGASFDIGTGEFELMTLVKLEDKGDGTYQRIVSRDASNSNWGLLRRATSTGGQLKFAVSGGGPQSTSALSLDTWAIVGVARDSSGDIQIYINGVADGSSTNNTADLNTSASDDLILGAQYTTAYLQGLQGYMAEFLLWETELTTAQRADVVQKIQDRYLNPQKAKLITCEDPETPSTYVTYYPRVGEIFNDSPTIIRNTGKYAGDIVGLRGVS